MQKLKREFFYLLKNEICFLLIDLTLRCEVLFSVPINTDALKMDIGNFPTGLKFGVIK